MAIRAHLDPSRIEIDGGSRGILLLHGYTGATPEVRPMAEFLAGKGMTVVAPLLPGHGTTPEDLNTRSWREVADASAEELYALQGRCDEVFVGGLSMGGLLTLYLGQRCSGITGLIPMAPAVCLRDPLHHLLHLLRHILDTRAKGADPRLSVEDPDCVDLLWSYDRNALRFAAEILSLMSYVRERLPMIEIPMLLFHGQHDRTVPLKASRLVLRKSRSIDSELVVLARSGHCLSVDQEREQVFARAWQWIADHSSGQTHGKSA